VGVYVGVEVPVGPVPPAAPAAPEGYLAAQPPPERPPGLDEPPGAGAEPPPAPPPPAAEAPPAPPPTVDALELAPLPPLPVASRGFWDGDVLELEAIVVDRATGQPRWRKTVERKVDPRDPAAVKAAVDVLLADGGWIPVY
jgi:hypothetical protein